MEEKEKVVEKIQEQKREIESLVENLQKGKKNIDAECAISITEERTEQDQCVTQSLLVSNAC